MKKLALTGKIGMGKFTMVSDNDFEHLSQFNWCLRKQLSNNTQYVRRWDSVNKRPVYLHHEIMGKKAGLVVDHINRNTLDNRRENLRFVTPQENSKNSDGKTVYGEDVFGVTKKGSGYQSQIFINGKNIYLGYFKTIAEASAKYISYKSNLLPSTKGERK